MDKDKQAVAPAAEAKKAAPATDTKKTAPATETKKNAPATDTKKTAPATDTKKTAPATETKKKAPVGGNKSVSGKTDGAREELAAGATLAAKPAEEPTAKPAQKPVNKTANKAGEKPVSKAETKATVKGTDKSADKSQVKEKVKAAEEERTPAFIADGKDKRPKAYAARVQIAARYTDDQARNMLRKKIAQYKEVHLRFLQKIEEPNAFKTEKLFVPVHCGKADVRYSWKTKVNGVESAHEEICTKERRFSGAKQELDVTNFLADKLPQAEEKKETELVENGGYDFKKTFRKFNACLKSTSPAKRAHIEKRDESYTLVYVPVMKTICTLDGEQYVGYVNLHNGACYSSYKVSDAVDKAASKAALAAGYARRTLRSTFLFSLTFCLLTLISALKLCDWHFGALTTKTVWVTIVLAAFSLSSLALMFGISAVKKEALIEKAVRMNKLPGRAWVRFASAVGVLCAVCSVLVFFFQVMI